jgi:hypothetical protein
VYGTWANSCGYKSDNDDCGSDSYWNHTNGTFSLVTYLWKNAANFLASNPLVALVEAVGV